MNDEKTFFDYLKSLVRQTWESFLQLLTILAAIALYTLVSAALGFILWLPLHLAFSGFTFARCFCCGLLLFAIIIAIYACYNNWKNNSK